MVFSFHVVFFGPLLFSRVDEIYGVDGNRLIHLDTLPILTCTSMEVKFILGIFH